LRVMPIQVQGPDGQMLEFPDGTDRETMRSAMAKRYGGPSQPKPDFSNVQSGANTVAGPSPTDGMSGVDKFRAGLGRSIMETGRGLRQAVPAAVMGIGNALAGDPASRALLNKRTEGFRASEQAK